jgi:hypothetical protein
MPQHPAIRHFRDGINGVSRWTGREMKEMSKVFLAVMANCEPKVVEAGCTLLDFMYMAHASSLTDDDLNTLDAALRQFHDLKKIFELTGATGTEHGFRDIPKIHMMQHYMHSVRMLGTPDRFNSELSERMHINFAKAGFRALNKVTDTVKKQMVTFIQCMEALAIQRAYLAGQGDEGVEVEDDESEVGSVFQVNEEDKAVWGEGGQAGGRVTSTTWSTWVREACVQGQAHEGDQSNQPLPIFYPNPIPQLAKTPTFRLSAMKLIEQHGMTDLLTLLPKFLSKLHPLRQTIPILRDHMFKVWSCMRLFHSLPPFRLSEPAAIETLRVVPPKLNDNGRLKRFVMFDMVLVHTYPNHQGIHRKCMYFFACV